MKVLKAIAQNPCKRFGWPIFDYQKVKGENVSENIILATPEHQKSTQAYTLITVIDLHIYFMP